MPKTPIASKTSRKPAAKKAAKTSTVVEKKTAPVAALTKKKIPPVKVSEEPIEAVTKEKAQKPKLVRDSFTMPKDEYAVLGELKSTCLKAGIEVKKSELLRIGISLLRQLEIENLKKAIEDLLPLKTGRPKKRK